MHKTLLILAFCVLAGAALVSAKPAANVLQGHVVDSNGAPVRAAVLLGAAATSVSVARSLARRGIAVHALGSGEWDLLARSRACTEYIRVEPSDLQAGWFAWLESSAARLSGAVVLPCADDGVELIARRRSELQALGYHPFEASDDVSLAMLDKERTYAAHAVKN